MRSVKDVLQDECGPDLTGWTLTEANGISADGNTIVGYGTNPLGNTEAWIAVIPEPGGDAALLALITGVLARRAWRGRVAHATFARQ